MCENSGFWITELIKLQVVNFKIFVPKASLHSELRTFLFEEALSRVAKLKRRQVSWDKFPMEKRVLMESRQMDKIERCYTAAVWQLQSAEQNYQLSSLNEQEKPITPTSGNNTHARSIHLTFYIADPSPFCHRISGPYSTCLAWWWSQAIRALIPQRTHSSLLCVWRWLHSGLDVHHMRP